MKKILTFTLIFLVTFLLVSCDFNFTTNSTEQTSSSTSTGAVSSTSSTTSSATSGSTTNIETTITSEETTEKTTEPTTTEETVVTTEEEVVYDRYQTINLYSINDFHGGTYSDISYLTNIGGFLESELNDESNNTVILSNGDIFQGSAISNYYYGEPIVEVFNEVGFDGFVIGNHEFDWGINEVLDYQDGDLTNGEMNCPILAANIVYEDSQLPLENTLPYIIKEVSGVKVGVIGMIGDIMNSISASRVENIEFKDPIETAEYYAYDLRVNQEVDIVVIYIHEGSWRDSYFANLSGNYLIDAVFNGHTHQNEYSSISRYSNEDMYYAQASNWESSLFAHISLTYDTKENEVIDGYSETLSYSDVSGYSSSEITSVLYQYESDSVYQSFITEELTFSSDEYSRYDLAPWGASVIRDYLGIDIGAVNSGGFRNSIPYGNLTMGDMIEIYPFDNYIKTCEMTGSEFSYLYDSLQGEDVYWDDSVYKSGNTLYVGGEPIVSSQRYTIGAVDYVFDKDYYGFLDGDNVTLTSYLMRDLLVEDLKNTQSSFNPNNGTSIDNLAVIYDPNLFKELLSEIYN